MQIHSWPEPPQSNRSDSPPEIPSEYTSFGVTYSTSDGIPAATSPPKAVFDKARLKELIDLSMSTFTELVMCPEDHEELIERISDIHSEINRLLNGAKRIEAMSEMDRIRYSHTKNKNELIEKIRKGISGFGT